MPIYEYQCAGCGHELEAIQRFSDSPLKKCPECGKRRLRKQISAAAFHLKGTGWYETDFKGNGKSKDAGDGASDAKSSDGEKDSSPKDGKSDDKKSGDKKSDSKSKAKPESTPGASAD